MNMALGRYFDKILTNQMLNVQDLAQDMREQVIQPVYHDGKIWIALKGIPKEGTIPCISVYPFSTRGISLGEPLLNCEPLMITNDDTVKTCQVGPGSAFFKQCGKYLFYYVVTNDIPAKTREFKLQQLNLESGENLTYKVTNLEEEALYDDWMKDWTMAQTDVVIWAEDK